MSNRVISDMDLPRLLAEFAALAKTVDGDVLLVAIHTPHGIAVLSGLSLEGRIEVLEYLLRMHKEREPTHVTTMPKREGFA